MSEQKGLYQLPKKIDHYLATLAKLYAQEGQREKEAIVVNAQVRIQEEWSYDNLDGRIVGHALYLTVPESLYLGSVRGRVDLQNGIRKDLNKVHNFQFEFIDEVFLEMEEVEDQNWRRKSGLLQAGERVLPPDAATRLWGTEGYRVFLSHKAEVKKETAELKEGLALFGITCFVAHEDVDPTKEWQEEIENAIMSMDAFVALMTKTFHESDWTDQEVGFALGRGVPLIAVKLGMAPYGFIGKFQALSCKWADAPIELAKLLIKQQRMLDAYITALPKCHSFEEGITLSEVLPNIKKLTDEQAKRMVSAFNTDSQIHGSWGFNGAWPSKYGDGLAPHLSRATGHKYVVTASGDIERAKP
jgi:hypothetical protein